MADLVFALRGTRSISLCKYAVGSSGPTAFGEKPVSSRVMTFSDDGSLFAYCNGSSIEVLSGTDFRPLFTIPRSRTAELRFSPLNTLLATWEPVLGNQPPSEKPQENLELWDAHTGEFVKGFVQRKQFDWCPQWSKNEKICSRNINNEIVFYEDNKFDSFKHKLHMAKVANYLLAERESEPYYVAVHMPGAKGQPSSVRIFQYPNFGGLPSALASKSFYKAETASLVWNSKGTSLLIHTATEASSASYYGEQGLHYVDVKGESCLVPRAKEGPVYSAVWSPIGTEFCVVYGCMPAKATLYNLKCEPVFDFGTGPRNLAFYNPHGTVLCLAGFGNLRGNMELWDVTEKRRMIANPQAVDSTVFDWCPDGHHFLTATTSPRLRIGNGYKIWNLTGNCLYTSPTWPEELYEAVWQSRASGVFPAPAIPMVKAAATTAAVQQQQQASKPKAYVPPALRNQVQPVNKPRYTEAYEPDSFTKQVLAEHGKEPSKSAIKNKKKREAKARRKQDEQATTGEGGDADLEQRLKNTDLGD